MIVRIAFWLFVTVSSAAAQGFAGLGTDAEGFAVPTPDRALSFPADHGPHPDYRIEWWYITATLEDAEGTPYGIQWTLFRSALRPEISRGWTANQLWLGHAGMTTADQHYVAERRARGGLGTAGVTMSPFVAFIDDWRFESLSTAGDPYAHARINARFSDAAYDLELTAEGPLVPQGKNGFSQKSPEGQASYYYSQPFYRVEGVLQINGEDIAVVGQAWLDREWSSQPLSDDQTGWDWFSLKFDDGARLMGFGLRSTSAKMFTAATWIDPDGTPTPFPDGALRLTPLATARVADRDVPVEWRLELPERGLDVTTRPLNRQSWMATSVPYWEGPIAFTGSHQGRGYLEMTGYE
ncbi:MAG: lipocalin-like domain-containing protein [Pseudomonadota bacterium]